MILRLSKFLSVSIFLTIALFAKSVFAFEEPVGFVNDFADVLSPEFEENLEAKLANVSTQQGLEIVIVTIRSLEEDTIENYAVELFQDWGIGKKDEDNGVLFLAAISDRKLRIEVGYGVEDKLNDAKAGRIIRDIIAPEFKNENYEAGIQKGADQIIASVSVEEVAETTSSEEETEPQGIIALVIFAIVFAYLVAFLARSKSWWAGGIIGFIIGVFVSIAAAFIFGLIGLILDYLLSSNYKKLKKAKKPTGFWPSRGGFWTGGGKSGGGFGGFGGGSSGGGGASGNW